MDNAQLRIRRFFESLVSRPSESVPLAEAALLIAAEEHPQLAVGEYLARIDALADEIREAVDNAEDARAAGRLVATFLHDDRGFHGNSDDYYDPRNSFLNEVLDRQSGIPITLSILYMEVARRLGIAVEGVGLPGHFVVRLVECGAYVDPFTGRADLGEQDCADRVGSAHGHPVQLDRSMLAGQTNQQILTRVLRNLLEIYRTRGELSRALGALDRIVLLNPRSGSLLHERADLHARMGEYRLSLRDLASAQRLHSGTRRKGRRSGAWRKFIREMASRMN